MQISQSCSACVGTKQCDPCVRAVDSHSALRHGSTRSRVFQMREDYKNTQIPLSASVCAYLTGSNTSVLIGAINGCVRLHEINLVFCILPAVRVFSLQRERDNSIGEEKSKYRWSRRSKNSPHSSFPSPSWLWRCQSTASRTIDPLHFYCNLPCT